MRTIFLILLLSFFVQAEESVLKQVQESVYQMKTSSSKNGVAFAIDSRHLVTTFNNILSSDLDNLTVIAPDSSEIKVQKLVTASFYGDLAVLKVKESLPSFLDSSFAIAQPLFYILGHHQGKQYIIESHDVPSKISNHFYKIDFPYSRQDVNLSGAPIINKKGKFVGVVYQNEKHEAHFVSSNLLKSLLKRKKYKKSSSEDIFQKERRALFNHIGKHGDYNLKSNGNLFHLRNILRHFHNQPETSNELSKYLLTGAQEGYQDAQLNLGILLLEGFKDFQSWPVHWIEQAARQNHREAQFILGMIYYRGAYSPDWSKKIHVHRDYDKAAKWLKRAAENKHIEAQFYMGNLYSKGYGVPQDSKVAFNFYLRAANGNYPEAQWKLAMSYQAEEKEMRIHWLEKAAKQVHREAQFNLGMIYLDQDKKKASRYFQQAAKQNHREAQFNLGMILFSEGESDKSQKWFKKAANQGHAEALKMISVCAEAFKDTSEK